MSTIADMLKVTETKKMVCDKHGEYESRLVFIQIWTKCPACEKEAREVREEQQKEKETKEAEERWRRRVGRAGIPERFHDRSLKSYIAESDEQKKALEFSYDFADTFAGTKTGHSAIFSGKVGTGKTHLAAGVALRIMSRYNKHAVFITVQRLIRSVRDTWSKNSERTESDVIESFVAPDLLILDEVGVQAGSDNEKQILFDVLNERYEKRKSNLLLTNLNVAECRQFLGDRVFDRLREDGGRFIVFDWESHRGKDAKKISS